MISGMYQHNESYEPGSPGMYTPHHRLISTHELNPVKYVTSVG